MRWGEGQEMLYRKQLPKTTVAIGEVDLHHLKYLFNYSN